MHVDLDELIFRCYWCHKRVRPNDDVTYEHDLDFICHEKCFKKRGDPRFAPNYKPWTGGEVSA